VSGKKQHGRGSTAAKTCRAGKGKKMGREVGKREGRIAMVLPAKKTKGIKKHKNATKGKRVNGHEWGRQ